MYIFISIHHTIQYNIRFTERFEGSLHHTDTDPLDLLGQTSVGGPNSGAGTNLKVKGAPVRRKAPGKFFWSCPSTFFGSKGTISRFGERFRDGGYSFVTFLFAVLLLMVPSVDSHLQKWGGTCPPRALWSWRHWVQTRRPQWMRL